jgi:hypothetical protein
MKKVKDDPAVRIVALADLVVDDRNANRGTLRGAEQIEQSLRKLGLGRSILLDKDQRVIAGNKTLEAALRLGVQNVRVIETGGEDLIAVLRTDLSLDTHRGREMAVADNRTAQVSLDWDPQVLSEFAAEGVELGDWFNQNELAMVTGEFELPDDPRTLWQDSVDMGTKAPAARQLTIYCRTPEDWEALQARLGQQIPDGKKSIWYSAAAGVEEAEQDDGADT